MGCCCVWSSGSRASEGRRGRAGARERFSYAPRARSAFLRPARSTSIMSKNTAALHARITSRINKDSWHMGSGPRRSHAETVELNKAVITQEVDKTMYLSKPLLPLRVRYIETPGYVKRPISTTTLNRSIAQLKADPKLYKDDDHETIFKPRRRPLSASVSGGAHPPFQTSALPAKLYEGVNETLGRRDTGWLYHFEEKRRNLTGGLVPWMAEHAVQPLPRPASRPVSRPPSRPGTASSSRRMQPKESLTRFIPPKSSQHHLARLVSEGETPWRSPPVGRAAAGAASSRQRPGTASAFRILSVPAGHERQTLRRSGSAPPRTRTPCTSTSLGKLDPKDMLL